MLVVHRSYTFMRDYRDYVLHGEEREAASVSGGSTLESGVVSTSLFLDEWRGELVGAPPVEGNNLGGLDVGATNGEAESGEHGCGGLDVGETNGESESGDHGEQIQKG